MKIGYLSTISIFLIFTLVLTGCQKKEEEFITLATTTSVYDSGLIDYLLEEFYKEHNIEVKVLSVGTGKAFEIAKNSDADILITHAKDQEIQFVEDGYGLNRYELMYDDFVLVGAPSYIEQFNSIEDVNMEKAFTYINDNNLPFISRGDNSGTYIKEMSIWNDIGIDADFDNYISSGKGMGDTLAMASEMEAITLVDRATFTSMKDNLDLEILFENEPVIKNQYSIVTLNPDTYVGDKLELADIFKDWLISYDTGLLINEYGKEELGHSLFSSNVIEETEK